mmetsp:Transcript_2651/g.6124  ORF Transcript_2651/g.6124 Transcript_2651/m.6124 type:complete len:256 (+) Transcript_2651:174-941(+)
MQDERGEDEGEARGGAGDDCVGGDRRAAAARDAQRRVEGPVGRDPRRREGHGPPGDLARGEHLFGARLAEERAAESGVAYSDGGSDSEDDGEEIDVTDDEVALINAIDQTHLEAQQRRLPSKVASPASAELSVHSDGREDMQRGRTATREKKSEVDLTGILHMGDAEFERLYAPAGRSRAGAAERGAKRLAKAKAACKNQPGGSQTSTAKVSSGGAAEGKPKRKRGRPPLTEEQKKRKPAYVPTGRPRGRPRKNA